MNCGSDAGACLTISIRIVNEGHASEYFLRFEEFRGSLVDPVFLWPNQSYGPRLHCFRTFGLIAHNEDRLAEGWALLLNSSGVGDQEIGPAHEIDKRHIIQRLDQSNGGVAGKVPVNRVHDMRVSMNGINELNVAPVREAEQAAADAFEGGSEALAAMRGDDDELFAGIEVPPIATFQFTGLQPVPDLKHGVDAGIPGNPDPALRYTFAAEIVCGAPGRGEMKRGQFSGKDPVHLFRKGLGEIAGPESGLNVANRNLVVEGCEGAAERGSGIALHNYKLRFLCCEDRFKSRHDPGGRMAERLALSHDVEVVLGLNAKDGENLIEHRPVLRGHTHPDIEFGEGLQVENDWAQLDCLRSGSEDKKKPDHGTRLVLPGWEDTQRGPAQILVVVVLVNDAGT